jgi:cell division septal protein FtsQ
MSLFSNSNANRRIKRGGNRRGQSLLEVATARPSFENRRPTPRQWLAPVKVLLCIVLLVGAIFGGRWAINRLIWENPMYQLSDIRVSTDGLLTRKQVLEIMEIEEGRNIFTVDLSKARASLDALPQVEHLEIRRILPDRIDVRISERQPAAWVAKSADAELGLNSGAFLVDTRGYVMRMRKVLPEHLGLPVITGVVMEDVAPGQKLPSLEALSALELIRASMDDVRWQPRVVDVSKGYCLVVTDQRRARITFGFDNIEGQLARLRQLIDFVEPTQREFQTVNLMLERNIPVTFIPIPAPPAAVDPKNKSKTGASKATAATTAPAPFVPFSPSPMPQAAQSSSQQASGASTASSSSASPAATGRAPQTVQPPISGGALPSTSAVVPTSSPAAAASSAFTPAPMGSTSSFATAAPSRPRVESAPAPKPAPPAPPVMRRPEPTQSEEESAPKKSKSKPRKPEPADKDDDELETVRPPKVERVQKVERPERVAERPSPNPEKPKATPVSAPASVPSKSKERPVPQDPAAVAPNEALRKLFNPHG